MTSIGNAIPADEFAELYHYRWYSEEGYKSQKCRVELENFSGKSVLSVYQDIFAKLLTANLTAILAFAADRQVKAVTTERKYRYAVNRTAAISKAKHHLVKLIAGVTHRIGELIRWVAREMEAIRPGRQFERKHPGFKKSGFHFAYKGTS